MPVSGRDCILAALSIIVVFTGLVRSPVSEAEVEESLSLDAEPASITQLKSDNPLDSTVTYPAAHFAKYDPVTAMDILDRIPGIESALNSGGGGRGLGAGSSSILIDGKRVAGKANSGSGVLDRIAAKQVAYVEVIRGSSADLDVRSAGPIVNVVLKEGASRSNMSAEIGTTHYGDGSYRPGGSLSIGGSQGDFDYLTSFTAKPYYETQLLTEDATYGDGRPKDSTRQLRTREQTDYELAGNFGYRRGQTDLLQLNAFYRDNSAPHTVDRSITRFDTNPPDTLWQWEEQESDRNKWEFGGNYQHTFDNADRFNLIFVINESNDDWYYDRYDVDGASQTKSLYVGEDKRERERIVRGSYTTKLLAGQDIELGVERAQTLLDKSFRLGQPGTGTGSSRFGGLLPSSDVVSSVEEIRYEPFLIHNWQLSSGATLESTLLAEISEISQEGTNNGLPVAKTRDFQFLKPKLDYRVNITPATQMRATVERYVSQLSFSNFTASSDNDLDKNVNAGNPDLAQQKSWRYEVNLEYRIADDGGVLNSRFFYHDIQDVIDRVDVSSSPGSWISAPGNIGDGKRYGLELDASIRLDSLDLPEALLTMSTLLRDSQVEDPFLHEKRRLSGEGRGNLKFGFRQDLPAWGLNYGLDYTYYFQGGEENVDIEDMRERFRPEDASLFLEKAAFDGVVVRLESANLLDGDSCYERVRFDGPTSGGIVEEVEDYCFNYGRRIALKIKATF